MRRKGGGRWSLVSEWRVALESAMMGRGKKKGWRSGEVEVKQRRSRRFSVSLTSQTVCVCVRTVEEGEEGPRVVYLRSGSTRPPEPGSPAAPPPPQPLLLLSRLRPAEPLHIQTR